MSNKGKAFAVAFLETIFRNRADTAGYELIPPSPAINTRYFALHTGAPDTAISNSQVRLECAYTGYTRIALSVSSGNTDTQDNGTNVVTLNVDKLFPRSTGGAEVATHWSLGTASSGVSRIMYQGALPSPMNIDPGVQPVIKSGSTLTET